MTAHDLFYRDGIRATGIDRLIAESGVAKKTFYRHYPSKNDLVLKFLDYRHANWMEWFEEALGRHGGSPEAIVPALREWFSTENYRGCAFINAVVELGDSLPEAVAVSRRHKADMVTILRTLLPRTPTMALQARALAVGIDGAIVTAQFGEPVETVLASLAELVEGMQAKATATAPAAASKVKPGIRRRNALSLNPVAGKKVKK